MPPPRRTHGASACAQTKAPFALTSTWRSHEASVTADGASGSAIPTYDEQGVEVPGPRGERRAMPGVGDVPGDRGRRRTEARPGACALPGSRPVTTTCAPAWDELLGDREADALRPTDHHRSL
jgi:hypothetical protein